MFVNETKICKFKVNYNINWYNLCLGILKKYSTKERQSKTSLNGSVFDFSADHS